MKKIEILSPCGSEETLRAAVFSGADAVYFGATEFNARRRADNFDTEAGLKNAVRFCHIYGVQVHLTVNISVTDREMKSLDELIYVALDAGVDAFIVSDLGVSARIREICPDAVIHASTQLGTHSVKGVEGAKEYGFDRVVLSREISKQDVVKIKQSCPDTELELFCHGALCMSFSGQCYFSSVLGGRSGNRGLCAGTCRLPFTVEGSENPYCLSLKDLSLVDRIDELQEIGIDSIKIEGRMKRPEYVSSATRVAVAQRDGEYADLISLKKVFSRDGFCDGYYTGKIGKSMFGYRRKEDVDNSAEAVDGINIPNSRQVEEIRFEVDLKKDTPACVVAYAGNRKVTCYGQIVGVAKNKPVDMDMLKQQLSKLGDTPYYFGGVTGYIEEGCFLSVSGINELRRKCISGINDIKVQDAVKKYSVLPVEERNTKKEDFGPQQIFVYAASKDNLTDYIRKTADKIIMSADQLILEYNPEYKEKYCVWMPRLFFKKGEEVISEKLKKIKGLGVKFAVVENIAGEQIAKEHGFMVYDGMYRNIFNSKTVQVLKERGHLGAELSFELSNDQGLWVENPIPTGRTVYGYIPLMLLECCPKKSGKGCGGCSGSGYVTDRMGTRFKITCKDGGYCQLYNSVPLWLGDKKKELSGYDFVTFRFTEETACQAEEILKSYIMGKGDVVNNFTRGAFLKGVQ